MVRIYFTKEFTKGLMKGLRVIDSIPYPTAEACVEHVKAINAKHARGKLDYWIIDKSFQNYQR